MLDIRHQDHFYSESISFLQSQITWASTSVCNQSSMVVVMETGLQFVFDELLKVVVTQTIQTPRFKRLENTLKSIEPVFYESRRLIRVLDRPQKETIMFISYLKNGKRLVLKGSRITFRNVYQKRLHSNKLIRFNNELLRFFHTELQVKMATGMRSSIGVNDLEDKVDLPLSAFTTHLSGDSSFCSVPGLIAGFNWHLEECFTAERQRLFMEIPWWIKQIAQPINPRILSLSTDEAFSSNWQDLKAAIVEELTLNIRSKKYSLPEFITGMDQLKVLTITSHSDYPSKLHNLSLIGCLSNLKTMRFEHVSVSSIQPIFALRNLKELSFMMCEVGEALMSCSTESPYMLTDLEIDMCYDLKELPSGLCNLVHLQKLSITNCHELDVLPKGLGGLSNLEILRLHCCTKLQELPESIVSLHNLSSIDISDCLSISALPEEIGELCGLRVLKMKGCAGLQELPMSMSQLWQLEEVICDEETSYLWMDFESDLHNLEINVLEDDRLEPFMKLVHNVL